MAAEVCWATETRAMRLGRDADVIAAWLRSDFHRSPAEDVLERALDSRLTPAEVGRLETRRAAAVLTEFSRVWAEAPIMAPAAIFYGLRADWTAD